MIKQQQDLHKLITCGCLLLVVVVVAVTIQSVECHDGDDEHDHMHAIQMTTPTPEVNKRLAEMSRPTRTRSTRYHLEWTEEPEVTHGYGETKLITNCINTGDHPTEQTISTNFAHTFKLEEGDELDATDLEDLLLATAKNHSVSFTTRAGLRSLVHEKVLLDKRTKGTVLFRDNLIKLYGKVRKVFNMSYCAHHDHHHHHDHHNHDHHNHDKQQDKRQQPQVGGGGGGAQDSSEAACKKRLAAKSEEYYVALKASEIDPETSKAVGTFSVDYFGTDKYKHPEFYNIANRMVNLEASKQDTNHNDDENNDDNDHHDGDHHHQAKNTNKSVIVIDEQILSPYSCAEHAIALGKTIGLYQVNKMRCTLGDMEPHQKDTSLLDRDGKLIGHFDFNTKHHLDTTTNSTKADEWKRTRSCDIILVTGDHWHCKKFQEKPSNVVMIRRTVPLEKTPTMSQIDKTSTTTTPASAQDKQSTVSKLPKRTAATAPENHHHHHRR